MAHTAEVKEEVLHQLAKRTPVRELNREYNISRSTLYRWLHDLECSKVAEGIPSARDYNELQSADPEPERYCRVAG